MVKKITCIYYMYIHLKIEIPDSEELLIYMLLS